MSQLIMEKLTADHVERSMLAEGTRLASKWEKTGLLEGLTDKKRRVMARLLENQARECKRMLKESSTVADIVGFQNVAFPMVRRAFGGLIANELVSVQPMALPSGLLFYLDYRYDSVKAGNKNDDFTVGGSVFGERNSLQDATGTGAMYNLNTSFSQRERVSVATFSGTIGTLSLTDIEWDPDLSGSIAGAGFKKLTLTSAYSELSPSGTLFGAADLKHWVPLDNSSTSWSTSTDGTPVRRGSLKVYRRHTKRSGNDLVFVVSGAAADFTGTVNAALKVSYLVASTLTGGTSGTLVLDAYESDLAASPTPAIPELDFRLQSVSVTAQPRKLKARWTPELAQDLAAYQDIDAEVELTQVMSEQIALEIDREILNDMLRGATGANFYWSKRPGNFLVAATGDTKAGASFTGTVREWYETLVETIIMASNEILTKTLRGSANYLVTSPAVCSIIEACQLYKPSLTLDQKETTFTIGTEKVGSLQNRFTVYKDPYFPKNKILLGFKGSGFLECAYVFAPYVPLITTPLIYRPDDMVPTKGMMTRYAKQMVRSDMLGTVTVQDMDMN